MTLRRELAAEDTILRKDIEVLQALATSQMPENLENEVSPQEVADLITYLREAFGPAASSVVTLFEDEASFATVLSEGAGTATLIRKPSMIDRGSETARFALKHRRVAARLHTPPAGVAR